MNLAYRYPLIFWNCANLIVDSGGGENIESGKTTDYVKIARAINKMQTFGVHVSLVNINSSGYTFIPDVETNSVLYGLSALSGVNDEIIEQIIKGRPYYSFKDFLKRTKIKKPAMLSLIKAGAFDKLEESWAKELNIEPRVLIMIYYLYQTSDLKQKLNLQNFNGLMQRKLVPDSLSLQKQVYEFNKYLKTKKVGKYYVFDNICEKFYSKHFNLDNLDIINGLTCISQDKWDKIYQKEMDSVREWLSKNQQQVLQEFNTLIFLENWHKYAEDETGNYSLSSWEMQSVCFYYHEHELKNVNTYKYGIRNFFNLPEEPEIDYFFKRNGKQIPIYKLCRIMGTVISKDDNHSSVDILTVDKKVVTVKFTKEYYAMFARQISEKQENGKKKIVEKGWMIRGTKIICCGFRRGDTFQTKTYKHTNSHQLYKINQIYKNGEVELVHDRYGFDE